MIIHKDLQDFFQLLNNNNVDYVIVGGYAVAFHGFIRGTKDIDILFRNNPDNIEKLSAALNAFGLPITSENKKNLGTLGSISRIGVSPIMIELINAISGISFDQIWEKRIIGKYGNTEVRYISRIHLLINKKASGRSQDIRDIEELEHMQ